MACAGWPTGVSFDYVFDWEWRIAEIGRAIDDLAAEAAGARTVAEHPGGVSDSGHVVTRLAELWALLAELDPDIARRLPTYQLD